MTKSFAQVKRNQLKNRRKTNILIRGAKQIRKIFYASIT